MSEKFEPVHRDSCSHAGDLNELPVWIVAGAGTGFVIGLVFDGVGAIPGTIVGVGLGIGEWAEEAVSCSRAGKAAYRAIEKILPSFSISHEGNAKK